MKKLLLFFFVVPFLANAQSLDNSDIAGMAPPMQGSPSVSQKGNEPAHVLNFDSKAYGCNSNAGPLTPGPFSFYLNDTKTSFNSLPTALPSMQYLFAGGWLNNLWYAFLYSSTLRDLVIVDTVTGALTLVGNTGLPTSQSWEGIAMDVTTNTAYAISAKGSTPYTTSLWTINLSTGIPTLVGTANGVVLVPFSINKAGNLYAVDVATDYLGSINKTTGAFTPIGHVGFNASYAQGMDFDRYTDTLYWACLNVLTASPLTYVTELRTVDVTTGATTVINQFPDMSEITAFAIPYDMNIGVADIQKTALALKVNPNPLNPAQSGTISFTTKEAMGNVTVELFDVCGKRISSLMNERLAAGNHQVTLNAADYSPGVYFCRLHTLSGTATEKLIIAK